MELGYGESTESWAGVLRDLRERGLAAPLLAVGDGALGLWAALSEVFPAARHQRCWNHRGLNLMDKLPKRLWPEARRRFRKVWSAPTRAACEARRDELARWLHAAGQDPAAVQSHQGGGEQGCEDAAHPTRRRLAAAHHAIRGPEQPGPSPRLTLEVTSGRRRPCVDWHAPLTGPVGHERASSDSGSWPSVLDSDVRPPPGGIVDVLEDRSHEASNEEQLGAIRQDLERQREPEEEQDPAGPREQ
jgi:hypothetical protein